jgi:hypothetical protein
VLASAMMLLFTPVVFATFRSGTTGPTPLFWFGSAASAIARFLVFKWLQERLWIWLRTDPADPNLGDGI